MFRIKSKGCNLIFKDPKLPRLYSTCSEWKYIEDDVFNNSAEIKCVLNFLIFEKVESIEVKEKIENNNIIEVAENIFVHNGYNDIQEPDQINTFAVKAPEDEIEIKEIEKAETKIVEVEQETLVVEPPTESINESIEELVSDLTTTEVIIEGTTEGTEVKKRGRKPKIN